MLNQFSVGNLLHRRPLAWLARYQTAVQVIDIHSLNFISQYLLLNNFVTNMCNIIELIDYSYPFNMII